MSRSHSLTARIADISGKRLKIEPDKGEPEPTANRFRILDRKELETLENIRDFLLRTLHLRKVTSIFQQAGGQSGDLGVETMEYEVYTNNQTTIYLLSVVDDTCNGYNHIVSLLSTPPTDSKRTEQLMEFLDQHEFVSSHSSFQKRPTRNPSFYGYLDEIPNINLREAFHYGPRI